MNRMNGSIAGKAVWIVVPSFKEGERLRSTLGLLCRPSWSIVVVDDGSMDDTRSIAADFPVALVSHPINLGQGAALQTGFDYALAQGAQWVVTFDADGQHQVADIPALLEPLQAERADVALGSRFLGKAVGIPASRRIVLKLGVLFTRIFSGIRVTDTHNGARAFTRKALRCIRIRQNRMAHASELLDQIHRSYLRFEEVPVTIQYSAATLEKGQSGFNGIRIVMRMLLARITQ